MTCEEIRDSETAGAVKFGCLLPRKGVSCRLRLNGESANIQNCPDVLEEWGPQRKRTRKLYVAQVTLEPLCNEIEAL